MNKIDTPKLVFIAGLGHSGSTLFDLLLGAQKGITGLGEMDVFINKDRRDWFLERFDKYPCTCGKNPSECSVWGDFKSFIESNPDLPYAELYAKLFHIAVDKTGSDIIVDSSKNIRSLRSVYESLDNMGLHKDQFYVLHLVKDVRSFTTSSLQTGRGKNRISVFRNWMKSNRKFEDFINNNMIKSLRVGYDELTLSTSFIMEKVMEFLKDGNHGENSLDLTRTGSHIISGNNMRHDQADSIRYDYRWFNDFKINLYYSLFPKLNRLNEKWVYSNVNYFMNKKDRFKPPRANFKDN